MSAIVFRILLRIPLKHFQRVLKENLTWISSYVSPRSFSRDYLILLFRNSYMKNFKKSHRNFLKEFSIEAPRKFSRDYFRSKSNDSFRNFSTVYTCVQMHFLKRLMQNFFPRIPLEIALGIPLESSINFFRKSSKAFFRFFYFKDSLSKLT